MNAQQLALDVTSAAAIGEPVQIAATLHLPDTLPDDRLDLIFAIHGGGYTRGYWDPGFADDSYSFARFFTNRGKAVATIDMLGMGESSRPEPEAKLSRATIAAAHAAALAQIVARFDRPLSITGVGHSMGGLMIITQAADYPVFDRVAVIGWANEPMVLGDTDPATLRADLVPSGYLPTPRVPMRGFFYAPDVPLALIEADEASGSTTPSCLGRDALTPGIVHEAAARIAVPVLVVHSAIDTSSAPERETAYFSASPDVELQRLADAAHCQNFASNRADHWHRLDEWIDRTAATVGDHR